ncbi:MAG TPA: two-component regulator propeller domain-containing protein [Ignavibacteria bacterium]
MKKKSIFTYLIILTLSFSLKSFSQYDNISFEHVSIDNNAFHFSINTILQDKTGFLWFGTRIGLSLYDGKRFLNFRTSESDSSLSSDLIRKIFETSNGDIWIGTANGINKYIYDKGYFKRYIFNKKNKPSLNIEVRGIIEDKSGYLWIATNDGLKFYDSKKDTFITFYHDDNKPTTIQANDIKSISLDSIGNILLGYDNLLLDYIYLSDFNYSSLKDEFNIYHYSLSKDKKEKSSIMKILVDSKNQYWIGTNGNGVYKLSHSDFNFNEAKKGKVNLLQNKGIFNLKLQLSSTFIRDIIEDFNNNIWIATFGGGLNLYDQVSGLVSCYKNDQNNPESINSDFITSLYIDRSKNLWIGTYTGGLNKYSFNIEKFRLIRSSDDPVSLSNNLVTAVYQDNNGILWVGTRQGLNIIDRNKKKKEVLIYGKKEDIAEPKNLIRSIIEDNNNRIWIGTHDGLNCIDKNSKRFILKYNLELQKKLDNQIIRALLFDKETLWIGSDYGLYKYDLILNKFKQYLSIPNDSSSLSNNYIWSLYKDKFGNLWVGTKNGLNLFNEKNEKFKRYYFVDNNKIKEGDNLITTIISDYKGNIWIGTFVSGLHVLEPEFISNSNIPNYSNSKVKHFSLFPDERMSVSYLMIDENQNIWFGTDEDIIAMNKENNSFRAYNLKGRIFSNELNTGSGYAGPNGEFFFGSNNGLICFYPSKIKVNKNIPNIVITSFKKFNKEIYSSTVASKLKELNLTYKDNNFSFTFAALDLSSPIHNKYKYKLDGYDIDWINAENKNEAIYMNLPGGEYTFRVIGSNQDNIWNLEGVSLKLSISPPYWETLWFRISLVLFITFIIYLYFRSRLIRTEKQKKELQRLVELRTFDLKEANLKLQNEINERKKAEEEIIRTNALLSESNSTKDKLFSIIAHDLRGSIGNFMSMLRLLVEEPEVVDEKELREILKNLEASAESTYNLLENLLNWAKTQRNAIELNPKILDLNLIVNDVISLSNYAAKSKGINITSKIEPQFFAFFDQNTITTVLRNLISNAIKFTKPGGNIWVEAESDNNFVVISINDDGVGIPKEKFDTLFIVSDKKTTLGTSGEKGTGLGLMLCKEFVELNKGKIWVESEVGKGTSFKFTLPIN